MILGATIPDYSNTQYYIQTEQTDPVTNATPFSALSEREQDAFLESLEQERVSMDSRPSIPDNVVKYQDEYYQVRIGIAEGDSSLLIPSIYFGGIILFVLSVLSLFGIGVYQVLNRYGQS